MVKGLLKRSYLWSVVPLLAAGLWGFLDWWWAYGGATMTLTFPEARRALLTTLAAALTVGLPLGAILGLAWAGGRRMLQARLPSLTTPRLQAPILLAALALPLLLWLSAALLRPLLAMKAPLSSRALLSSLVAVAITLAALWIYRLLLPRAASLLDRAMGGQDRPWPFTLTALVLAFWAFTLGRGAAGQMERAHLGWLAGLAIFPLTLGLVHSLGLLAGRAVARAREGASFMGRALSSRQARMAGLLAPGVALATAGLVMWAGADAFALRQNIRLFTLKHTLFTAPLALSLLSSLDKDGDGSAPVLGGWDCDDQDPETYDLAKEIAGNSKDEDCRGGDLDLKQAASWSKPLNWRCKQGTLDRANRGRPSVILIVADAFRASHMSAFGYDRDTTPNIETHAKRGVRFTHAFAPTTGTRSAMPALLTGLLPSRVRGKGRQALAPGNIPLARILSRAGYLTKAVVSHDVFGSGGLGLGFTEVESVMARPSSAMVTDLSLQWLRTLRNPKQTKDWAPLFLLAHYYDAHNPQDAPKRDRLWGKETPSDAYDGMLRHVDRQVGRLLKHLFSKGDLAEDTLVILASDHGMSFGEHGELEGGYGLYNEDIQVPLVFWVPGMRRGNFSLFVSTMDVVPTVLNLIGLDHTGPMDGKSLASVLKRTDPLPKRCGGGKVMAEILPTRSRPRRLALMMGNYKLIKDFSNDTSEIYHLRQDMRERRNIYDSRPKVTEDLERALWSQVMRGNLGPAQEPPAKERKAPPQVKSKPAAVAKGPGKGEAKGASKGEAKPTKLPRSPRGKGPALLPGSIAAMPQSQAMKKSITLPDGSTLRRSGPDLKGVNRPTRRAVLPSLSKKGFMGGKPIRPLQPKAGLKGGK